MIDRREAAATKKNTVKTDDGIEVYENEINRLCDAYISEKLENPEDIQKTPAFRGMLKYVYRHLFKPKEKQRSACNVDTADIDTLNDIWETYTDLCYRYGKNPTILNFSMMTGVTMETINTWKEGKHRTGHSETVQKWYKECEGSLYDKVTETGNIGAMFALKACYGYTEAPQQITISNGSLPTQTAAEIAARHTDGGLLPPELPENV